MTLAARSGANADAAEIAASPSLGKYGLATTPLSRRLDAEQLRSLRATARLVGIDPATLEGLRPWLAGQLLENAHRDRSGVDSSLGDGAEIEYLMWTLDRVAQQGAELREQVAAWLVGDGSVTEAHVAKMQRRYPALYLRLLVERNRAWDRASSRCCARPQHVRTRR